MFVMVMNALALASAPTGIRSPSQSPPRYVQTEEFCDLDEDQCGIETLEECELAAVALGRGDTQANALDTTFVVAGCSTNNQGNLRFNANLNSTAINAAGAKRYVFCRECDPDSTLPTVVSSEWVHLLLCFCFCFVGGVCFCFLLFV